MTTWAPFGVEERVGCEALQLSPYATRERPQVLFDLTCHMQPLLRDDFSMRG